MDVGEFRPIEPSPFSSLRDLIDRYRLEVSPTKRGGAQEAIRLTAMAKRPLSSQFVARLTPKDVAEYRDSRLREVGACTVNRDLDDLSAVINHVLELFAADGPILDGESLAVG